MPTLLKQNLPMLALLCLLFSCGEDEKPKAMLSDEEMVSVLVELHLVEARADLLQISADSLRPLLKERYAEIFAELQIDTTAFNTTFSYYEKHPGQMDSLYQKVVDRLVELEATYRSTVPDSIIALDSALGSAPVAVDSLPKDSVATLKKFRKRTP